MDLFLDFFFIFGGPDLPRHHASVFASVPRRQRSSIVTHKKTADGKPKQISINKTEQNLFFMFGGTDLRADTHTHTLFKQTTNYKKYHLLLSAF